MKIESVKIKNFRTFADETIHFGEYTCLVGPNGAGKSTVLNALNVFFRQYTDSKTDLSKLSADDFHHKNTAEPIEITVTFSSLSPEAQESLSDYVRQGKLIVTARAEYDEGTERAEVRQYGNRLGIPAFREWFEAEKDKRSAVELKEVFAKLRTKWPGIDAASSKAAMADALRSFEANNPSECELIPSEDQFYGVTKGANRLAPHIQWVFVAASKDASQEAEESKNSALGQLLLRVVRSKVNFTTKVETLKSSLRAGYQEMLDAEQAALHGVSSSLERKLKLWANPSATARLLWKNDPEKSVKVEEPFAYIQLGEKGFESELARFGHGMQRSYMLALLQEIAEAGESNAPTLVMGIEEPELYQHPPQARYLAEVLQELTRAQSQIIVCSHSPHFIPGDDVASVRVVREEGSPPASKVKSLTYAELSKKLADAGGKHLKEQGILAKLYPAVRPETSEMFFCRNLVLVEGIEDVAYLTTYIHLLDKVGDFRRNGFHIVPVNGKSELLQPVAIADLLGIPVFVICDADTDKTKEHEIVKHRKDNSALLKLLGYGDHSEWPDKTIAEPRLRMWQTNLTDVIENELGDEWKKHVDAAAAYYGNPGGLIKNPLAISRALESAWNAGVKSESLVTLISDILAQCGDAKSQANGDPAYLKFVEQTVQPKKPSEVPAV